MGIQTVCRDCIFATYDGKTQTGCSVNRIDLLVEGGGRLIEAFDENGAEFYVIRDKLCRHFRSSDWIAYNKTSDNALAVREEMEIDYAAIVIANNSPQDLRKTLRSINKQRLKANHIIVVRELSCTIPVLEMVALLRKELKSTSWNLRREVDGEIKNGVIHDAVKDVRVPFYSIFKAGFEIPKNLFHDLDIKINDELLEFGVIMPNEDGNGLIGSTNIYNVLGGNLPEKLQAAKCKNMILQINEVFPSFP